MTVGEKALLVDMTFMAVENQEALDTFFAVFRMAIKVLCEFYTNFVCCPAILRYTDLGFGWQWTVAIP